MSGTSRPSALPSGSSPTCDHALKRRTRHAIRAPPAHWQGLGHSFVPQSRSADGNTVAGCGWVGAAPRGRWRITRGRFRLFLFWLSTRKISNVDVREASARTSASITDKVIPSGTHSGRRLQEMKHWNEARPAAPGPARRCEPHSHAWTSFRWVFAVNEQPTNRAPRGPGELLLTQEAFERVTRRGPGKPSLTVPDASAAVQVASASEFI